VISTAGAALSDELHELLAVRALKFGQFTLTSGRTSDFYVDGRQVTLDGRGLYLIARLVLEYCREHEIDAVGGLTMGADPIAAGVAALSGTDATPITAFIVRKEVRDHGTGRTIEGPDLRPGMRVLLVDDTLTTGGTFLQAQEKVAATGATIVGALCVVDREEGGRAALEAAGLTLHCLFRRSDFSLRKSPS